MRRKIEAEFFLEWPGPPLQPFHGHFNSDKGDKIHIGVRVLTMAWFCKWTPVKVTGASGASWLFRGNTTDPDVYCAYNDGVNGASASEAVIFWMSRIWMLQFPLRHVVQLVSFLEGQSHVVFSAAFFSGPTQ